MRVKKFLIAVTLSLLAVSEAYADFSDGLMSLEGVISVDVIEQKSPVFREKYIAWFVQPLDWASPDSGSFLQRVEIGYSGYGNVNVVYVRGYDLSESTWEYDDRNEIAKMYGANYISIEHRYFGKSVPEGLSNDSTALWEYLNDRNAAADFHNIIEQLREILPGKWAFTGTSKGGQAVNIFSRYYPEGADAFVSYVAPFCDGADDTRLGEAVCTVIGDERYGREKAEEYRGLLLSFQVEAIRNRDYLQPSVVPKIDPKGFASDERKTAVYFELSLSDFPVYVWQYDQNFDKVRAVLNMPHESSQDKKAYLDAMAGMIISQGPVYASFAYTVQSATENGSYRPCLKYLREALKREGLSLVIREDEEPYAWQWLSFSDEQMRLFTFDPSTRNDMLEWTRTTESNVIMIYGNSDPWYFVRLPDARGNPNVHIFTLNDSHMASIGSMTEEQRGEVTELLNTWLGQEAGAVPGIGHSGGGCDSGAAFGAVISGVLVLIHRRKS